MTDLQASWLGSWKASGEYGKGRRWGDVAWALVAISQAWMLGGHERRWPGADWIAKPSSGPRLLESPKQWDSRPHNEWIALLRHGSAQVPAWTRGKREDELRAWCWEALLEGDGSPWMSYGSVLLDVETRLRWIPLLAAVDSRGCLHLPPYLHGLIPEDLWTLPQGWWDFLLRGTDASGRLQPEGTPHADLPWVLMEPPFRAFLDPLILKTPPPDSFMPWVLTTSIGWMVDPHLRAWVKGQGLTLRTLQTMKPVSLARGDEPHGAMADILMGHMPREGELPLRWQPSIRADLEESMKPPPPPASGDPVLDRLRSRWGGELPSPVDGYPPWGCVAHPCADPYHWMAEGRRAHCAHEMQSALRAFMWAHAHFIRLKSPFWARRAAANASQSALFWGDFSAVEAWRNLAGPEPAPYQELSEARLHAVKDEWDEALPLIQNLVKRHPDLEPAWALIAYHAMTLQRLDWIQEALLHLSPSGLRTLLEAYLGPLSEDPPQDLDREHRLLWELHRVLRNHAPSEIFWRVWDHSPDQPLRLGTALALLEVRPDERTPGRLLMLQSMVDRAGSKRLATRLEALWPKVSAHSMTDPWSIVQDVLNRQTHPLWIAWGGSGHPRMAGTGARPPEGALSMLRQQETFSPVEHDGWIWRGFPLHWESSTVGVVLAGFKPDQILQSWEDLQLLAPWIARLNPVVKPAEILPGRELLTDGSEPMGTFLQELARVAPSELPVLILGPTGSGKELTAQEIHQRSGRPGPLVPVNCSAFAEGVLESELFGHVRGAFTGADRDRKGAIETASGGTLFLDEVADLSPRLQSMFLRVLQEHEVRRVGSDRSHKVDVRFLAATHKSLEQLSASGTFRKDLLYRLQGSVLVLPSLQARRHEFPYLIPRLVTQVARDAKRPAPDLDPALPMALARLPWTGNFRELRHAIERALLRCGDGVLQGRHFPELESPVVQEKTWEEATREFQRKLLLDTLRQQQFRASETARVLGITRPAMYIAAKRMGLDLIAERRRWETGQSDGS